jgi:hypothetical protein
MKTGNRKTGMRFSGFLNRGLVLTSAAVGAGPRACPNEGNHRGIAPTKNGLK